LAALPLALPEIERGCFVEKKDDVSLAVLSMQANGFAQTGLKGVDANLRARGCGFAVVDSSVSVEASKTNSAGIAAVCLKTVKRVARSSIWQMTWAEAPMSLTPPRSRLSGQKNRELSGMITGRDGTVTSFAANFDLELDVLARRLGREALVVTYEYVAAAAVRAHGPIERALGRGRP
jgi:hypothetical protein